MHRLMQTLRHRRRSLAWTLVAMLVALGGGLAVGVLTSTPSSAAAPAPATTIPSTTGPATTGPATPAVSSAKSAVHRVRGTVTALSPTSLTLRTAAGRSVTVAITPSTRFGAGRTPAPVAVGDTVVVAGTRSSAGKWTATRIRPITPRPGTPRSAPTSAPPTTPAAG